MVTITYINHSGFLMEWDNCYWLFDYYNGTIPDLDPTKSLLVFSSHNHGDHFNPEIFQLIDKYPKTSYILSYDIRLKRERLAEYGITEDREVSIISVKPRQEYQLSDGQGNTIVLKTLRSTDRGVAFLLDYLGKTIYHAGDLNDWVWKEETEQRNRNMTANFHKELEALRDVSIDVAFAPLDPRQEEWYYFGLDKLLTTATVKYTFPMHFWGQPSIIEKYKEERGQLVLNTEIMDIMQSGQSWKLNL